MYNPVIGISGVATSGKDTFGKLLIEKLAQEGYVAKRFALADELKKQVAVFILEQYGIDIFDCTLDEKNLVRPIMVAHGEIKRKTTEGTYWLSLLDKTITQAQEAQPNLIPVVTDVRYAFYPNDESFWIQKEKHGLVVHVKRFYTAGPLPLKDTNTVYYSRREVGPANETEAKHDGAVQEKANYRLEWATSPNPDPIEIDKWCRKYVPDFFYSAPMQEFLTRCTK